MRLWTIWTIPATSIAERLRRTRDWAAMTTASMLPLRVRYWVTMMELGKATIESPNVPATDLSYILRHLAPAAEFGHDARDRNSEEFI